MPIFYQNHAGKLEKHSKIFCKMSGILKTTPVYSANNTLFPVFFTSRQPFVRLFSHPNPTLFILTKSQAIPILSDRSRISLPELPWPIVSFSRTDLFCFPFDKPKPRENRMEANKPVLASVQLHFKTVKLTKCQNVKTRKNER